MKEKEILKISVWVTLIFGLFGITSGVIINSGMVIFDGIYSFISVGLSCLSIAVVTQIQNIKDDVRFPFGKHHFEPFLIVFKSVLIITMCLVSMANAVSDIANGGREVNTHFALIYSSISSVLSLIVLLYIKAQKNAQSSAIISAESDQWLGDTLLSIGVLAGFGLSYFLQNTSWNSILPFADPAMVLAASTLFLFFPIRTFIQGFKEIILLKADQTICNKVSPIIDEISKELGLSYKMRLIKNGRELFLEINFLSDNRSIYVKEMDEWRTRIENSIDENVWLNLNFTQNKKWL